MARNNQRGGSARRAPKDLGRRVKKKPCALCRDKVTWVDYKDVPMLRKYMSDRGKIRSRRVTGNCAQHQRALAQAIKTARELVLLPYTQRTVTERPGGRRGDRERALSDVPTGAGPGGGPGGGGGGGGGGGRGGGGGGGGPVSVSVEVTDETDNLGDPETELAERAEVEELVEELAEDAAAQEIGAAAESSVGGGDKE
jgi:small subunit ribosomal protein S18